MMPIRAALAAALLLPMLAHPAAAQFPPTPQEQAQQQQMPQQEPPCMKDFVKLRDVAVKRADAIKAASQRKASPQEACGLFKNMVEAEAKVVKFAQDQGPWCGIPPQAIEQMKGNHVRTVQLRTQICNAAAQAPAGPARPPAPTLSDALGAPAAASSRNVRRGTGTFDTLSGTGLGTGQ